MEEEEEEEPPRLPRLPATKRPREEERRLAPALPIHFVDPEEEGFQWDAMTTGRESTVVSASSGRPRKNHLGENLPDSARVTMAVITFYKVDKMVEVLERMRSPTWSDHISYFVCQLEECPSTKRRHWQCYLECAKQMRVGTLRRSLFFDPHLYVEARRGTREDAREYCIREFHAGTSVRKRVEGPQSEVGPIDVGTWDGATRVIKRPGMTHTRAQKLQELDTAVKAVMEGQDPLDLLTSGLVPADVVAINRPMLNDLYRRECQRRASCGRRQLECCLFYGTAGGGKSETAEREALVYAGGDMMRVYRHEDQRADMIFNGVEPDTKCIIFDEGAMCTSSSLLNLLDNKPVRLKVLYSYVMAAWEHAYVTSNILPRNWLQGSKEKPWPREQMPALARRFHWIVEWYGKCGEYTKFRVVKGYVYKNEKGEVVPADDPMCPTIPPKGWNPRTWTREAFKKKHVDEKYFGFESIREVEEEDEEGA